jgi:hypothetical protein
VREQDREDVVEPEAGVIEGEDDVPRQPAPPLDPYTPEPAPRPGERRAWRTMRLAWLPVLLALAALLVYALTR